MKIKYFILYCILSVVLTGCSSTALLLVNSMARHGNYTMQKDIPYADKNLNKLDLYQPMEQAKGVIVFFYGGCWGACQTLPKSNYRFVAQTLTQQGYTVVIPDYRLYPKVKFLQIMRDAADVVKWVGQHLQKQSDKPIPIILMGHSAGAHMAAMLTTNRSYLNNELYENIAGFVGLAGPYDFIFDQPYQYELFSELEYDETQPSFFVSGAEPPMLLLYGNNDKKVHLRNIVNFRDAIKKQNGKVVTHIYDNVDHAQIVAALSIPLRDRYNINADIIEFLNQLEE